jgi:aspartate racemase
MHIGLIGGIGPASTELYYRTLVRAHAAAGKRLSLTIVHADLGDMIANMEAGDAKAQAAIFAVYVDQLKAGGCEVVALTSMGGHFCIEDLLKLTSLPIISAVDALDAYFLGQGVSKVGVLGTRAVMESGLYGVSSTDVIAPPADVRPAVHQHYTDIARAGAATEEQRQFFEAEALKLYSRAGAEMIVLGGTDLFLAFDRPPYDYPIADCALIYGRAIANASMTDETPKNPRSELRP